MASEHRMPMPRPSTISLIKRVAELEAALLFALPLLEEECRPGAPLLRQVYAALKMNQEQK